MPQMLSQPQPNVTDNSGLFLSDLGPSPELAALIRKAAPGRPVYHLGGGRVVPALQETAEWHRHRRNPGALLRLPTAACLEAADSSAAADLLHASPRAHTQFRKLFATAVADIEGADWKEIAAILHGDEDARRQVDRDMNGSLGIIGGRELWKAIGAWPWWAIAAAWLDGGSAPPRRNWWELPRVEQTLAAWLR